MTSQELQNVKVVRGMVGFMNKPASVMKPVLFACPFDQWDTDIVGPFPIALAQKKFLLVVVDYFSKWVKAEALEHITEGDIL